MTTSWTRTREQLGQMVLRKIGVLEAGEAVVSADAHIVYEAFDARLKEMHRLGTFWRKVSPVPSLSFTLTASTNSASATADILFPIQMTVSNNSADDPVIIVGIREWNDIADKTETGVPEKCYWKGGAEFLFWPIPDQAYTAKIAYEKFADDTSAGAALDIDVSMIRWMKDVISYDVADDFKVNENKVRRFQAEAIQAEKNIRMLAVQKVEYTEVQVDGHYPRGRRETDYGR